MKRCLLIFDKLAEPRGAGGVWSCLNTGEFAPLQALNEVEPSDEEYTDDDASPTGRSNSRIKR